MSTASIKRLLAVFALAGVVVVGWSQPALAQDCGSGCESCFIYIRFEGVNYTPLGEYNMRCLAGFGGCQECPGSSVNENERGLDATGLLELVAQAPAESLGALIAEHRDRLLLHTERGVLAVRGTACNPDSLPAVIFLDEERTAMLATLGVNRLDRFLAAGNTALLVTE